MNMRIHQSGKDKLVFQINNSDFTLKLTRIGKPLPYFHYAFTFDHYGLIKPGSFAWYCQQFACVNNGGLSE